MGCLGQINHCLWHCISIIDHEKRSREKKWGLEVLHLDVKPNTFLWSSAQIRWNIWAARTAFLGSPWRFFLESGWIRATSGWLVGCGIRSGLPWASPWPSDVGCFSNFSRSLSDSWVAGLNVSAIFRELRDFLPHFRWDSPSFVLALVCPPPFPFLPPFGVKPKRHGTQTGLCKWTFGILGSPLRY